MKLVSVARRGGFLLEKLQSTVEENMTTAASAQVPKSPGQVAHGGSCRYAVLQGYEISGTNQPFSKSEKNKNIKSNFFDIVSLSLYCPVLQRKRTAYFESQ